MLLGCIGDDFTGSSDIGNTLSKAGMQVTQYNGVPDHPADASVEAGVVSLKTRSIPVEDAVSQSIAAAQWLLAQNCQQLYFKYCSTFDSTREGNIGPVAQALAELVGEDKVIICPAFPAAGRTVYQGNLFVGDIPLAESGMRNHPITPMTDSDIRRWLSHQTSWNVEHLPLDDLTSDSSCLKTRISRMDRSMIVADIVRDEDFAPLAQALDKRKLVTGASGLAMELPRNFYREGKLSGHTTAWEKTEGPSAILCGSCSSMSRAQIAAYSNHSPSLAIDAFGVQSGKFTPAEIGNWVFEQDQPPLVFSSDEPDAVARAQQAFGLEQSAKMIESFFGELAVVLFERGMRKIVCAGGETSGAIVSALDIKSMSIGPEITAGVPALKVDGNGLSIVLKSGNFGQTDFFEKALEILGHE